MNGIFALIPIMFLGIGVTAIISSVMLKMQRLKVEEARLRAGDSGDITDLVHKVSVLENELTEVQERLDFAERMLAQVKVAPALPAVPPPDKLP